MNHRRNGPSKAILVRTDALRERECLPDGREWRYELKARWIPRNWPQVRTQRATLVAQSKDYARPVPRSSESHWRAATP